VRLPRSDRPARPPPAARWSVQGSKKGLPGGGALADTVDVDDCRRSYYAQLFPLNPGGIVPSGPTAAALGLGPAAAGGAAGADPGDVFHDRAVAAGAGG
jgi:putative glutathione S-transferase